MKELIETIVKSLVDQPDDVQINIIKGEKTSVIELSVAKDDLGKVIGKGGQTARAIRILMQAVSARQRKRAVLEILE